MTPDLGVAVVSTLGTVVVAVLGLLAEALRRHYRVISELRENTREAREQVKNSHGTNLRDDIDDLHVDVRQILTEMGRFRDDLALEREERLEVSRRLDAHLTHLI